MLLYGASFADCLTPRDECFGALLESSELGSEFVLHNYGVGGYGLDQMYLLYLETIALFEGLEPIVIFAPVVESDIDRTMVDFRSWPKPRFSLSEGELVLSRNLSPESSEYLEQHGTQITSYAWRYLLHGTQVLPKEWAYSLAGDADRMREQGQLVAAIQAELQANVTENDHEAFFLLFHAEGRVRSNMAQSSQEQHLVRELDGLGLSSVDSRGALLGAASRRGVAVASFYFQEGKRRGHMNSTGNAVVLETFLAGLRRYRD